MPTFVVERLAGDWMGGQRRGEERGEDSRVETGMKWDHDDDDDAKGSVGVDDWGNKDNRSRGDQ